MPTIDQFESTFRHAAKDVYSYEQIRYENVLVVTDLDEAGAEAFSNHAHKLLEANGQTAGKAWKNLTRDTFKDVQQLLNVVKTEKPDLICTYRNLHSVAWQWPYSLGEYLDVLSQAAQPPVLVLPHPSSGRAAEHALENTDVVMAMTDHLSGDDLLVNHALGFVEKGGNLVLAHVEDGATFDRYIETISKIASIDTENARAEIQQQLLDEPTGYIDSCQAGIQKAGLEVKVIPEVRMGHHIAEYRRMVEEHKVDLLVINTKDEDQLAMHGLAYPVAVELREIPLLML